MTVSEVHTNVIVGSICSSRIEQEPGEAFASATLGLYVRRWIGWPGAKLFSLPKYAPDLHAIEQIFAKLKHLLRSDAPRAVDTFCS